jgi:hypothetical protein
MLLGVAGLLFAFLIGSVEKNAIGFSAFVGFIALLLLLGGIRSRKKPEELAVAQESWDKRWTCARCGNQWEAE